MQLTLYQIDAFTQNMFSGNPAAVIPLDAWLPVDVLQSIATENNLSETAYFVAEKEGYRLRWFTPVKEVDLCGHATLASAYIIFHYFDKGAEEILFHSRSGELRVRKDDAGRIELNFPTDIPAVPDKIPDALIQGLGTKPLEILKGANWFVVYENEDQVRDLRPDMHRLKTIKDCGVIVTAHGDDPKVDFVSRFFIPSYGIDEDPVTGSAHTTLTPYWSEKLGKTELHARQISRRGGELWCAMKRQSTRVRIAGKGVFYMKGVIHLDL